MSAGVSRRSLLGATRAAPLAAALPERTFGAVPPGSTGLAAAICSARFAPRGTANLYQRPS
jgi:uncharacterized protein (DUF1501 family)